MFIVKSDYLGQMPKHNDTREVEEVQLMVNTKKINKFHHLDCLASFRFVVSVVGAIHTVTVFTEFAICKAVTVPEISTRANQIS